jgi:crotonobetainyl-CoA:carnitine CoA-transferase CaiB-like acyl-CoA transferase
MSEIGGASGPPSEEVARPESGALAGVRILDLTTVIMGPYATQILGDMGAKVLKVEAPGGDDIRHVGPMRSWGMGHMFLQLNRGKKSVVLDLKKPAGREALLRLARSCDVFVYNVRPQAMARLGLGYSDLASVNPRIVYVGAHGFGQAGPYAARPAYDDLIQGMVGLPWLMRASGASEPRFVPATLADHFVGLHVVYAILGALFHRERTGRGQAVEVPMFECMAQLVLGDHLSGRAFEPPVGPAGYNRVLAPDRKPFATRDGHLCVLIYNDKQWKSFLELIGRSELFRDDPRFTTHEARARHFGELSTFVAEQMRGRTTAEWLAALARADIPATAMASLDDLIDDPHLAATGFVTTVEHPSEGTLRTTAPPLRWSDAREAEPGPAPRLGEHGREVLAAAGYSAKEIEEMIAEGVTRVP